MAQTTCGEAGAINGHEVDITDHDIEQLLFEAEGRLRAQNVNSTNIPDPREVSGHQPQHTLLRYVKLTRIFPEIPSSKHACGLESRLMYKKSIPRLSSDCSLQPYVLQKGDLAAIDTTRVLKNVQDAKNGLGYKEPKQPEVKKVRRNPFPFLPISVIAMRKIIPSRKRLIQLQQSVLGCAVPMRAKFS